MKIGIVGGTFNPVHLGHLMIGEYAYEQFALDEVWFLPNGNPPHKDDMSIRDLTMHRIHMLENAIKGTPYFKIETYELEQDKVCYSYETMQALCKRYTEHEFYFIIGTDSLFQLEHWKRPDLLTQYCHFLVACRDFTGQVDIERQISHVNKKYHTEIHLLQMPILEVSSSELRERIANGLSIKYVVPTVVEDYIKNNNLYSKEHKNGTK